MTTNKKTLISELEKTTLLAEKYSNIEIINCDRITGKQLAGGGCLSVVFKALDTTTNKYVAIKFMDPDIKIHGSTHRFDLFEQEPKLLNELIGRNRCMQLVQDLTGVELTLTDENGNSITKDVYYFVVEWLDENLLHYSHNQTKYSADEKLDAFRNMVLAVAALHNASIFHRDLKPDNFCNKSNGNKDKIVVAIDLGTAAKIDSQPIGTLSDYARSVGAPGYAPIEALCGLAHIRKLGIYSDIYALGCILFDFFNYDYYFYHLLQDRGYLNCKAACDGYFLSNTFSNDEEILNAWNIVINENKGQITLPQIHLNGSTVPLALKSVLNVLLHEMTATLYSDRCTDFNRIVRLIDAAKRTLKYPRLEEMRRNRQRTYKENKAKKIFNNLKENSI